ncbi:hypothetical protein, partial [Nocardioides salarius]|uniref:HNH endonuclease n=1 Tax=Nocardioides salarius TaxID=374513 RepID=UPI0030FB7E0C
MPDSHDFTYKSRDIEQTYLKLAMLRVWDGRCCWCTDAIGDTSGFQIDHAIPETKVEAYKARGRTPMAFDVPDGENLAPIHGGSGRHCNQRKSNAVDKFAGAIDEISLKAQQLAPAVRKLATEMLSAEGFERSILEVLAASMPDGSRHRASFEANAPMLVARINALCPDAVDRSERFWSAWRDTRDVPGFYCLDDVEAFLALRLDPGGRAAKMIADSYAADGFDLAAQVLLGASAIVDRLEKAAPPHSAAMGQARFEEATLRLEPGRQKFRFVVPCFVSMEWDTTQAFDRGAFSGREGVTSGWFTVVVLLDPSRPSQPGLGVEGQTDVWTMSDWEMGEA